MIGRILFGFCTISMALVMVVVMFFINNLPGIMRLLIQIIRQILYFFYLVYQWILSKIASRIRYKLNFSVFEKPYRTAICTIFSITIYLLSILILGKQFSVWIAGCAFLHGYLIGSLWKDFFEPGGLNLGESIW